MLIKEIYVLKDKCAECIREEIFLANNKATAIRLVKTILTSQSDITDKAKDLQLQYVGDIDMITGKITKTEMQTIISLEALLPEKKVELK